MTFTIALEMSLADKVFAPYDSRIFHTKGCKKLHSSSRLIEFPSVQTAITDGALACDSCILPSQSKPSLGDNGTTKSTLPSDTKPRIAENGSYYRVSKIIPYFMYILLFPVCSP